jgi:beta-galactosidase/beta-glucuronidase
MRDIISLGGIWEYKEDPQQKGLEENWITKNTPGDDSWSKCYLPNAAAIIDREKFTGYKGDIWFYRTIAISKELVDRHLELCFDQISPSCEIYLKGKSIFVSDQSEISISIPLSKDTDTETPLPLMIRLSDIDLSSTSEKPDQVPWFGIIGNICLKIMGQLQFMGSKIRAYPTENYSKGHVDLHFNVQNTFGIDVYAQVVVNVWHNGTEIFNKLENFKAIKDIQSKILISFDIENPLYWSPQEPNLYELHVKVARTNKAQDNYIFYFGIRELKFEGKQAILNKTPIKIIGTEYQHFYPECGPNMPLSLILTDLKEMKEIGINTIYATSPLHQKILEAADRLGFLVIYKLDSKNVDLILKDQISHPSICMWASDIENFDKIANQLGINEICLEIAKEIKTENDKPKLIAVSKVEELVELPLDSSLKIIKINSEGIYGKSTRGKQPYEVSSEDFQAEFFIRSIKLLLGTDSLISGVICGTWADESGDFGYNSLNFGIVTANRTPKKAFHEIKRVTSI